MSQVTQWTDIIRNIEIYRIAGAHDHMWSAPTAPDIRFHENGAEIFALNIDEYHRDTIGAQSVFAHIETVHWFDDIDPDEPSTMATQIDQVTIIRTDDNQRVSELHYDDTVGMMAPTQPLTYTPAEDDFAACRQQPWGVVTVPLVIPTCNSEPGIVTMGNVKKHYQHGKLHRKSSAPAISADYIGAIWHKPTGRNRFDAPEGCYERGRINGPSEILIRGYKEFHTHGEFCGCKWDSIHLNWDTNVDTEFLKQLQSATDPKSTKYFGDIQEEMGFLSFAQ